MVYLCCQRRLARVRGCLAPLPVWSRRDRPVARARRSRRRNRRARGRPAPSRRSLPARSTARLKRPIEISLSISTAYREIRQRKLTCEEGQGSAQNGVSSA